MSMRKNAFLIIITFAFWGCVTFSQTYKLGNEAEINKNWDKAIKYYEQAQLESPNESIYRLALARVKTSATLFHLQEARRLANQGKKEEAQAEYNKALSYDPMNMSIMEEMKNLGQEAKEKEETKKESYEFPIKLKVSEGKVNLKFAEASLRSIFQALGKHAGVNIIFDEQFKDVPLTIDLADRTFKEAVNFVCMSSRNFYRIIDDKTLIVVPDQPMKRLQYEANTIKVFYLSNIKAQEIQNPLAMMLRTQFKTPNITVDKNLNSVTIRDTPEVVAMAEKLLKVWDKAKGEVLIDLEILEVSRTRLKELGVAFSQQAAGLKFSTDITNTTGWENLKNIDFTKTGNFFISLPTALVNFLESDSDTKVIAQPRLRGVSDEEIKYLVGQKVPIPQTTFTPIAAGGVSQQPIMSYTQQDVGLDVKIKPKIHFEKEITLELEVKITSLGGKGIADIPIINTREVKNIIRLKDGETNLMAGLLREEERKSLKGIAGLKNIPLLGSLFSNYEKTVEQTDVILTITPYIIRGIPLSEEDLKPLWVDVEGISSAARIGGGFPGEEEVMPEVTEEQPPEATEEEAAANEIFLDPANFEVPKNREFRISVNMNSEQEISTMTLNLRFDAKVMRMKDALEGGVVRQLGEKVPFFKNIDNTGGSCTIGFSSPEPSRGVKGAGSVAVLVFEAVAEGEVTISISSVTANSPTGKAVSFQTSESQIVVR
jgi:general secretion pathway protein D